MSTTAATQAIRDFNNGIDRNPYLPEPDKVNSDHDVYNAMMKEKWEQKCQN